MQRITITIDDDLLETIDTISAQRGYASRSETLRDLVRDALTRAQPTIDGDARCYATCASGICTSSHRTTTRFIPKRIRTIEPTGKLPADYRINQSRAAI